MTTSVLILGGGLQAMSTAYSLKRHGYTTICISTPQDECRNFKYIDTFLTIPYQLNNSEYTIALLQVIQEYAIQVIIPMSDSTSEYVCTHKEVLESISCHCSTPHQESFTIGTDKARFMHFCEKYGFSHPRTMALTYNTIEDVATYVGFPAMIKPNRSVGARGIKLVHSVTELKEAYPHIQKTYGDCTLQEYVDCAGLPYYNVMLYRNQKGQILGSVIIEILRYFPIQGGSSSLCKTIDNPELLQECIAILSKLNWVGMADFDVLVTPKGEYKIIEINPRVPASLRAADIAGINFPEIICCDLLGQDLPTQRYKTNMYLRYFGLDIMWFLHSPHRFHTSPSWFCSIGHNFYFQDIYATAPGTWFRWLSEGFKRYLAKRKHIQ